MNPALKNKYWVYISIMLVFIQEHIWEAMSSKHLLINCYRNSRATLKNVSQKKVYNAKISGKGTSTISRVQIDFFKLEANNPKAQNVQTKRMGKYLHLGNGNCGLLQRMTFKNCLFCFIQSYCKLTPKSRALKCFPLIGNIENSLCLEHWLITMDVFLTEIKWFGC